jgi:hypothetical protein
MEAPISIVVSSPDGKAAELVGRAIGQSLRETYGFKNVAVANIIADAPGFRAWNSQSGLIEQPQSLLDAMREANPDVFSSPVMVISREDPNTAEVNLDGLAAWTNSNGQESKTLEIGGIGEEGVTFEELQEQAWLNAKPAVMELAEAAFKGEA